MHETKEEVSKKELLDVAMKTVKTAHDELIQTLLSSDTVFAGIHVEYEAVRSLVKSTQEMVVELRQRMSELERRHEIIEGLPIIRLRLTEQEILASGKVTIENKKL